MRVRLPQRLGVVAGSTAVCSEDPRELGWRRVIASPTVVCQVQHRLERQANGGSMSTANKEISRRFTELFSTGDETLVGEVLSPDVVFHGTAGDGELRGIE